MDDQHGPLSVVGTERMPDHPSACQAAVVGCDAAFSLALDEFEHHLYLAEEVVLCGVDSSPAQVAGLEVMAANDSQAAVLVFVDAHRPRPDVQIQG